VIVAFYSFKGGVGRTLTLANCAMMLAIRGKRVGIIDLDIEAPGIASTFDVQARSGGGLLDVMLGGNIPFLDEVVIDFGEQRAHYLKEHDVKIGRGGALLIIPSLPDPEKVEQIRWDSPSTNWLMMEIAKFFRINYRLDYLFIDARSGLSVSASYSLALAELVLAFFRLNRQNIEGARKLVSMFAATGRDYRLALSAVTDAPAAPLWRAKFLEEVGVKPRYELPFQPELLFEERLYAVEAPDLPITQTVRSLVDTEFS
jgi:MinD-like ATPase involved in chromosome partitioning or flagellar assembly